MPLSEHEIQVRSIIKLSSWIITCPFYIYALIKWHQFNGHFLIQKRFTSLSYTIFALSFSGATLSFIADLLFHYNVHNIITYFILSLTFVISGLNLFRMNLVYLKWKLLKDINPRDRKSLSQTVHTLSPMRLSKVPSLKPIGSDTQSADTEKHSPSKTQTQRKTKINIYKAPLSILILLFICVGSIISYTSHTHSLPLIACTEFAVLWIAIVLSIFHLKRNNVKEEIGCIAECYAMLLFLLVQMILEIVIPFQHKHHDSILQYSSFYVLTLQGMVTLYIPLVLLLKYEGTLHLEQYQNTTDEKVFVTVRRFDNDNDGIIIDSSPMDDATKQSDKVFVNKSLFQFLYKNKANHSLFSDYLQLCFALESLLFVERVSIFYQMVLKVQKMDQLVAINEKSAAYDIMDIPSNQLVLPTGNLSDTFDIKCKHSLELTLSEIDLSRLSRISAINMDTRTATPNSPGLTPVTPTPKRLQFDLAAQITIDPRELKYIYRFEFEYLTDISSHYQEMIDINDTDVGDYNVNVYKQSFFNICTELYDQFISPDSVSQVNLSDAVCRQLQYVLKDTKDRETALQQFQSYDDFLTLFDGAVIEAYRLMVNVYCYRFKYYVKDQYADAVFE